MNVFAGADFYFDRDTSTFGPLPRRSDTQDASGCSDDEGEDTSDASSTKSAASSAGCRSLPDLAAASTRLSELEARDTESCPAFEDSPVKPPPAADASSTAESQL